MTPSERLSPRLDVSLADVGGLRRHMPVSLERLYENLVDWERLPHVHRTWVSAVQCGSWGAWGWCADVADRQGRTARIELNVDRSRRRWSAVWRSGPRSGWRMDGLAEPAALPAALPADSTAAAPGVESGLQVTVRCLLPSRFAGAHDRLGRVWAAWLERVWRADEAMMVERQRQLDRRIDRAREGERHRDLGPRDALSLPCVITLAGREFVVAEVEGELRAYPARCPHQLGPLQASALVGRTVSCPWHGDRFDVVTGENLSDRPCRLGHLPAVHVDPSGRVRVSAAH
jgi:nitrite reductase/ring-hydroxylating ferredoxin subunit